MTSISAIRERHDGTEVVVVKPLRRELRVRRRDPTVFVYGRIVSASTELAGNSREIIRLDEETYFARLRPSTIYRVLSRARK